MNISKLCEGMIIKNYKELCSVLSIRVCSGNSKKSQLKELETYCNYTKEGNKFIINKIYDKQRQKEDNRILGNGSKYSNDIQDLLIYLLYNINNSEGEICWSCNTLLHSLSMINSNYIEGRRDMDKLSNKVNIDKEYVYDFYNNTHKSLKSKLESALRTLSKRALVISEKVLMIVSDKITIEYNDFHEPLIKDGKIVYKSREYKREATKEEKQVLLKLKKKCFNELNCKDESEIIARGKWKKYESMIDEELNKQSIKYFYYAYKLTYNKEDLKEYTIGDLGQIITKLNLNKNIVDCLIKGAITRHNNVNKGFGIIQGSETKVNQYKMKKSNDYIDNNKKLVNELIKPIIKNKDK